MMSDDSLNHHRPVTCADKADCSTRLTTRTHICGQHHTTCGVDHKLTVLVESSLQQSAVAALANFSSN